MSIGIPNNVAVQPGAVPASPNGGPRGPGGAGRPPPMARMIEALKSGDPARIQRAQQFLQKHPEVAQRLAARLYDPASQQKLAARIAQHGGNPAELIPKLQQLVSGAAPAGAAAVPK